ncbi:MAG TPA: hypothetical protein VES62_07770 [Thermoleophilaceae bacterium]|nr:hypothetical protein [Thermoleophilaceae bacterium]
MADERKAESTDVALEFALRHPALSATVLLTGLALVKILLASKFSIETALGLVASSPPSSIILGLIVTATPQLLVLLAASIYWYARWLKTEGRQSWLLSYIAPPLVVLATLWTPIPILVVLGVLAGMMFVWYRRSERMRATWRWVGFWDSAFFALFIVTLFASQSVWLGPEVIRLRGGIEEVAYVVSVDSEWVTLLRQEERTLQPVRQESVKSREPCRLTADWPSLIQLFDARRAVLPSCPPA